jgi:hypothetical protein
MDQNTPRDDAAGAQPPADANQQPAQDYSQGASGGGQDSAAEYAAWSADAAYQQQADTQAYAAPQPQSATYSDPGQPTADQQYAQPQYQQPQGGYDPAAYQQPQYQQPQY